MKNQNNIFKNEHLISQMTLEEKASLMSGENFWNTKSIPRLNIPSMMLTDGPHGLRKQGGKADHLGLNKSIPATCFPTAATLANSWDVNLLNDVGAELGKEAAFENVSILLGPGLNIKRNPLCGRNFEYFSEDPYLSGKLAASMVKGVQSQGVSACPKHFAVNSQETHRMVVDEIVDKRALHEIYLEGFRYSVEEGNAKTIMTSYNRINGTYANENNYILDEVLKNKWGFNGLIVTDWGGNNNRVDGLIAGNQLEMPSANKMTDKEIVEAVKKGDLDENILNERVDSYLSILFEFSNNTSAEKIDYNFQHNKAYEAAKKSMVLLKNDNNILPLNVESNNNIAVIGDFAETARYQGAGSSLINPTQVDNPLESLKNSDLSIIGFEKGYKRYGKKSNSLSKKAVKLAKQADIVLLFLGLDESSEAEGVDRKHMKLPQNQIDLFYEIYQNSPNKNIIVILAGGAPVELPFSNEAKAILHGYLGGQALGKAITDVIIGEYNPSGKLAESYPIKYSDVSSAKCFPGKEATALHKESIFVGYRYFDIAKINVLYPFGYGLSYTTFEYSDIVFNNKQVSFKIKNTGKMFGEEVAQVYVKPLESKVFRAEKELKGFAKISLDIGEEKTVIINLDDHAFSYYNEVLDDWAEEKGKYKILVGSSSRDIRLKETVVVEGGNLPNPYNEKNLSNYFNLNINNITDDEFKTLVKYDVLPTEKWDKNKVLGYNDLIEQGRNAGRFGKFLCFLIMLVHKFLKFINKPTTANNVLFALGLPFRSVARMSGGFMNMEMLDSMLIMVNGRFFKGGRAFIKSWRKKRKLEKQVKVN